MRRDLESAPTQQKVLNYLLDASERGEPPPTLEELAVALGQAAKSNMHRAVKQLLGKGYLEWDRAESRAKTRRIRPTEKAWALRSAIEKSESVAVEGELTTETDARLVPLLWRVAAGQPILADEENIREHLPLPRQHVRGAEVFMLEVMGASMTGDGVLEGDYVVVVSQGLGKVRECLSHGLVMPSSARTRVASRALRRRAAAMLRSPWACRMPMARLRRLAMARGAVPVRTWQASSA